MASLLKLLVVMKNPRLADPAPPGIPGLQDVPDEPFQERWLTFAHAFEDFRRDGIVSLRGRLGNGFPRRGLCRCRQVLRIGFGRAGIAACSAPELDELLELEQDAEVPAVWRSASTLRPRSAIWTTARRGRRTRPAWCR
jgi:hypothetical protein